MRKLLIPSLWLCLAWLASPLLLDAQVLYLEDFDGIGGPTAGGAGTYNFPSAMLKRNVDNRTPAGAVAYVNEAWERREDFSFNVADSAAFSTSWYNPVGAADDWMWTPLIGPLPANSQLKWNAVTYDALYPDGYEVRVMTGSQGPPTGGTGTLGNQVSNSTVVFSTAAENTAWTTRTFSLSTYAGQSIYVGFRNTSNDKFLLLIDDIEVSVLVMDDATMAAKDTLPYTVYPEWHQRSQAFAGTIYNPSLNALTNPYMRLRIKDGTGSIVYDVNSATVASIASGGSATFTVPAPGPLPVGDYTVQYIAVNGVADPDHSNDTLINTFVVDAQTYARDNGTVTGSLGIGAGNGGYLGQDFDFQQNDVVDSVMVYVTRGYATDSLGMDIFVSGPSGPTSVAASTLHYPYLDDSARVYYLAVQGGGVVVGPGSKFAFEMIEFDSTLAIGTCSAIHTPGSTWINWPTNPFGTWANNEDFGGGFAKPYLIRPMTACGDFGLGALTSTPSCTGSNGTASASLANGPHDGVSYLWSNGGNTSTITALAPGTYTVTVTLLGTCSDVDSIVVGSVSSNPPVAVATPTDALCPGGQGTAAVLASGGTPGYTYLWSNGDTSMVINAVAGSYTVTVTDAQGCAVTANATIGEPSPIVANITTTQESAPGASDGSATAAPTGGTPPYTYAWSNGGNTATISSLPSGSYTVTITDTYGCEATDSTSILLGLSGGIPGASVEVFPNPSGGLFQLRFHAPAASDLQLQVMDMTGRTVYRRTFVQQAAFEHTIDLGGQAAGVYLLHLGSAEGSTVVKLELSRSGR